MIVFSALVPHSPLLIPQIGQGNIDKLKQSVAALDFLASEIYASQPDTIIIISAHANFITGSFVINQNPILRSSFKEFGDLVTNMSWTNDLAFGYQIKESCETKLPINLVANEIIDYGAAVPLYYLTKNLKNTKLVVLSVSDLSDEQHILLGKIIRENVASSGKRVAVIASGDLSHRLHVDSPAGFSKEAHLFDEAVSKYLLEQNWSALNQIDPQLKNEAGECGYRTILVLEGAISDLKMESVKLAYEAPFGIGYLTEYFKLNR